MAYQQTLPNGTVLIEEFRILGHLGSGGFANTYLATDLTLGREVAIKEYFPSELAIRADTERVEVKSAAHGAQFEWALGRFVREAKTLAKFRHPSVVRVFRVFNANATAYIVLEFVRGSNMEAWIKSLGRPPTQAELDELLPPLLDALEVVHGAGILHRDIKPANIYIRAADHTPVLLDFGAARYAAGDYAGTTAAIVSKGYSPHEAYATDSRLQGPWTDIYGLAATIYRALSGTAPPESTMRVLEDHCVAAVDLELPLSGGYRAGFLEAIDWALEVMPKQRPQSVAEWRYKLLPNTVALPKLRDANGEPTTVQEWNPMSDRQSDATTFDPPMGSMPRPSSAAQPTGTARARGSAARQSAAAASTPAAAASAAHGAARHSVVVGTSTSMARPRSGGSLAASSGASGAPRSAGGGVVDRQSQPVGNRTFVIGLALFAAGGLALLGQWFINRKPSAPAQIAAPTRPVESRDAPIIDRNRIEREAAAEQARKEREAAAAAEQARKEREAAAAAEQARKEREAAAAAEQARKEREAAAAAEQTRKEREAAAAAEQARKEREAAAAAEQARKEREAAAAAEQARKEREAAAAEQARKEREAAAAEKARKEREAAAAEQTRKEREAAAAEQARKEREAAAAEQARKEREAAAAEQARKEREAAAAEQARKEREAAAAEQARKEREAAAAEQARKEREAAAAEQARKEREAAAAEQARKERELADARRSEQAARGGVELAAANIGEDRKEREAATITGAPTATDPARRIGYLRDMQTALKASRCYDGALSGDLEATRAALAGFEKKYRGDVVKIDVASASSSDFERWLGWFWRQESFSCYEKPAAPSDDAEAARRREREAEEARQQRRREREAEEARQARREREAEEARQERRRAREEEEARQARREREQQKSRKAERERPEPKSAPKVYKAPEPVYKAPRSSGGGGGGGGGDLLRGGR